MSVRVRRNRLPIRTIDVYSVGWSMLSVWSIFVDGKLTPHDWLIRSFARQAKPALSLFRRFNRCHSAETPAPSSQLFSRSTLYGLKMECHKARSLEYWCIKASLRRSAAALNMSSCSSWRHSKGVVTLATVYRRKIILRRCLPQVRVVMMVTYIFPASLLAW